MTKLKTLNRQDWAVASYQDWFVDYVCQSPEYARLCALLNEKFKDHPETKYVGDEVYDYPPLYWEMFNERYYELCDHYSDKVLKFLSETLEQEVRV